MKKKMESKPAYSVPTCPCCNRALGNVEIKHAELKRRLLTRLDALLMETGKRWLIEITPEQAVLFSQTIQRGAIRPE